MLKFCVLVFCLTVLGDAGRLERNRGILTPTLPDVKLQYKTNLASVRFSADQGLSNDDNSFKVHFLESGGSIGLEIPQGEILITWAKLEEWDGAAVVATMNLLDLNYSWSGFSDSEVDDGEEDDQTTTVNTTTVNTTTVAPTFKSTNVSLVLPNHSVFNISVWVIFSQATINKQVVSGNSVKFTFSIENWPFQKATNNLSLSAALQTTSGDDEECDEADEQSQHTFNYGFAGLNSPKVAYYDSVAGPVMVDAVTNVSNPSISWIFHSFNKTLKYDPVMSATNAASRLVPSSLLFLALLLIGWVSH